MTKSILLLLLLPIVYSFTIMIPSTKRIKKPKNKNIVPILPKSFISKNIIKEKTNLFGTSKDGEELINEFISCISKENDNNKFPKLIIFDLDNTLWTPELYILQRKIQKQRGRNTDYTPIANKDISLFPYVNELLNKIRTIKQKNKNIQFGIASRTSNIIWAKNLLKQFNIEDIFNYIEIFPSNKVLHFNNIQKNSNIPYNEMLFFDDARDGKYGNCIPISNLGVLCCHCPNGINKTNFENALYQYVYNWNEKKSNTIIEYDGTLSTNNNIQYNNNNIGIGKQKIECGIIKKINFDKRFGFINCERNNKDIFFHFNNIPNNIQSTINIGTKLYFQVKKNNKNGKFYADDIKTTTNNNKGDTIDMLCFSMNLPFAALLANGYKTLETRNNTMFVQYKEGTQMVLHVGQRLYPDGNKHIDIMNTDTNINGNNNKINQLKSLPNGFTKGNAIAIVELGKTYETTLQQRCDNNFQRKVCAYGNDSGKIVTEIKNVQYLNYPISFRGQRGVFTTSIPKDAIPKNWILSSQYTTKNEYNKDGKRIVGTISG